MLLVIHGGEDALGAYCLISSLRSRGYGVTCAVGDAVKDLLPEEGIATISGNRVYHRHYQDDVQGMEHIRLPEMADMVLVYPATANGVKEMAEGGAKSFLGCVYLATKKPVALVSSVDESCIPAQAHLERLKHDGVSLLSVPKHLPTTSKARAEAIASAFDGLILR